MTIPPPVALPPRSHVPNLVAFAAAVLGLLSGCGKAATSGAPIAWSEVSIGSDAARERGIDGLNPLACAHRGDGKVYYVEGYPHWPDSALCRNDDCNIDMHRANDNEGRPVVSSAEGKVRLIVAKKGLFGGFVDSPDLTNATTTVSGVTSGTTRTTTGQVAKDSLALYLSDGTKVNNLVRVRTFFQVKDTNGVCELVYVGGVRAPQ